MVRIGIIGTGRMALQRAKSVCASLEAQLVWLCSRSRERARELLQRISEDCQPPLDATCLENWQEALRDPRTDAVVIATPNALHLDMGLRAIEAGKAVFMEYPHAIDIAGGEKLIEAARAGSVPLYLGLTHRYGESHRLLQGICSGKSRPGLGRPVSCQIAICSGNPISRWYDKRDLSGGMFVSSMFHHIDDTLSLFGDFRDFSAAYWKQEADGLIRRDCASVMIEHESGCVAQLSYARGMAKPGIGSRRRVVFEGGYLVSDEGRGGFTILTPEGEEHVAIPESNAIGEETRNFIELISAGEVVHETARQAQRSLELAAAAQAQVES